MPKADKSLPILQQTLEIQCIKTTQLCLGYDISTSFVMIALVGDERTFFRTIGEYKMNINAVLVIPALLGALLLTACGEKAAETTEAAPAATEEMAPAAEAAAPAAAAPAEAAATTGGGYEPTAEERVPGITMDAPAAPAAEATPAPAAE